MISKFLAYFVKDFIKRTFDEIYCGVTGSAISPWSWWNIGRRTM